MQKQQAATRIQSQFRSYYAQKRYKRSRDAALLIQHHYRAYKEHEQFKRSRNAAVIIQQKFRSDVTQFSLCCYSFTPATERMHSKVIMMLSHHMQGVWVGADRKMGGSRGEREGRVGGREGRR